MNHDSKCCETFDFLCQNNVLSSSFRLPLILIIKCLKLRGIIFLNMKVVIYLHILLPLRYLVYYPSLYVVLPASANNGWG